MIAPLQSKRLLTIIIITYNRLHLLRDAISSCMRQTDKNFNLLIYDNGSSDGTEGFLRELKSNGVDICMIRNDINVFSMKMFERIVPHISTPWATILTDDDMLKQNFSEVVNSCLSKMTKGILVMGFDTIDKNGTVISSVAPMPYELDTNDAVTALFSSNSPETAGIGGFVCLSHVLKDQAGHFWDYPRLFFCDTRLVLEGVLTGGVNIIGDKLYQRRQWEGAESHSSVEQIIAKFEAQMLFMDDCIQRLDKFSNEMLRRFSKHFYGFRNFFNVNVLPCLLRPTFSTKDGFRMINVAYKLNKRFIPHCIILTLGVFVNCNVLRRTGKFIRRYL